MKTIFNLFSDDWKRVKNHCRTTDNKDFTENEATETFKKKLLISEHSPIRLLEFDWSWKGIYYWLSTEWSRHKFEKFISSQRDDRLTGLIFRIDMIYIMNIFIASIPINCSFQRRKHK